MLCGYYEKYTSKRITWRHCFSKYVRLIFLSCSLGLFHQMMQCLEHCQEIFGHNWSKSQCYQVQPATCCDVSIFWLSPILRHIPWSPLEWTINLLQSRTSTGYFSFSTGSSITSSWFSRLLVLTVQNISLKCIVLFGRVFLSTFI